MSKMIYYSPAKKWGEALPIGNGKLAGMVYGGIEKERIDINDATLWSGFPRDYTNPKSAELLDEARELVYKGENAKADEFVKTNMHGEYSESYLPLGKILISTDRKVKENYTRTLDIDEAVLSVVSGGDTRESFISYPDDAMFYRMKFAEKSKVSIKLYSPLKSTVSMYKDALCLSGYAPDHVVPNYVIGALRPIKYNESKAMAFGMICRVETDGRVKIARKSIIIDGATDILITIRTQTGFKGCDVMPDRDTEGIKSALGQRPTVSFSDYENIKHRHIEDYKAIFSRHTLELDYKEQDVPSLLRKVKKGEIDTALVKLLYDYGKYMIVSGSRDSQPLNLQGQWNKSIRPPWSSNLTTNINFQMNYWGAAACNLTECIKPFYTAAEEISQCGVKTARINYNADGFACNHNVDIWRMTTPVKGNPAYMYAPLCGAWIANEAYAHTMTSYGCVDKRIVDITQQASLFCLDYLTPHDGKLVTCPSGSAEAEFFVGAKRCALDYASALDMGIVKQCLMNCVESTHDEELKHRCETALDSLYGYTTVYGRLNEWHDDKPIVEKGHRHFSPLYGLYPAKAMRFYADRELVKTAESLLDYRMNHAHNSIGWSAAWAMCLYARLHRSQDVMKIMGGMMANSLFENLFGFHPPTYFQIDGNLGFVAAINEMLFYEEGGIIDLLPACPDSWRQGAVRGHKINGIELNIEWYNGKVIAISADKPIRVNGVNVADTARLNNVKIVNRI